MLGIQSKWRHGNESRFFMCSGPGWGGITFPRLWDNSVSHPAVFWSGGIENTHALEGSNISEDSYAFIGQVTGLLCLSFSLSIR